MLYLSYAVAAIAIVAATFYLFLRLRLFITTSTMLVASLLLIYGPAFLSFTLSSGRYGFLIGLLMGGSGGSAPMYPTIKATVSDLDSVITAMNFSIALMYLGVVIGIEIIGKMMPERTSAARAAWENWSAQTIHDDLTDERILVAVIAALFLLMLFFSISENHVRVIAQFFSIKNDNTARDVFRAHHGGSPNYIYRVVLYAIAPMLVIWGFLTGIIKRSWLLLATSVLLFLVTMLGKIEMLAKAPPAFFLLQIALATLLAFTNRISWRIAIGGIVVVSVAIYVTTRLIVIFPEGASTITTVYSRIFEVENETLLENFAVFPQLHPFMWGANIRPIALLMGLHYVPSWNLVADVWYHNPDITSPTLFIADAWIDFSYAGVLLYSVIAGAVCRLIDVVFLAHGKSVVAIAVLAAAFWGLLTLLTTALNAALLSGGLLLAPAIAAILIGLSRRMAHAPPSDRV
jgi:hypothetical protein